jgi:ABC-type multidrug transport system ATPase subunit
LGVGRLVSNTDMEQLHTTPVLKANALKFSYGNHTLFNNLNVCIPHGITLIRGGDGRGKSTLLRLLAGEIQPDSGQLHINEISAHEQPAVYRAQLFREVPGTNDFDQLTVLDYFASQQKRHAKFNADVLERAVAGLGLGQHQRKQLFMLSTGSKRKVWVAAAFASGATVTLLDEPFAALDGPSISFISAWLAESASTTTKRAWVIADYVAPGGLVLAHTIDLGD